mmetsp:Transcript_10827/g.45095  ORF Transcript_10827/g.45095 Transcript_10827/m.45095 type:complete len:133 (+) Transcript_10827:1298-1696(+)
MCGLEQGLDHSLSRGVEAIQFEPKMGLGFFEGGQDFTFFFFIAAPLHSLNYLLTFITLRFFVITSLSSLAACNRTALEVCSLWVVACKACRNNEISIKTRGNEYLRVDIIGNAFGQEELSEKTDRPNSIERG